MRTAGGSARSAAAVAGGVLGLTADAQGAVGGVTSDTGARYGRWEARLRAPAGAAGYSALLSLAAGPAPGQPGVDAVALTEPTRQQARTQLHGTTGTGTTGSVRIDATQWHNWAVEWSPAGITTYVDGQAWWTVGAAQLGARGTAPLTLGLRLVRAADAGAAPAGPLLEVDWVARYALPDTAADGAQSATATTSPATTTAEVQPDHRDDVEAAPRPPGPRRPRPRPPNRRPTTRTSG